MKGPLLLDGRLGGTLVCERGLHGELALAHRAVMDLGAAVELAQLQSQHFGREPALLFLQRLVAARRGGLPLQMADLLVDLVAHVLQALEVLARLAYAAFGLAAPLLVLRDASRLLDEGAHVLGLGLDDARDHALLDDRVAARAEAGAQEQLRDVLAAAARAIDEVARGAIARNEPLQRDFVVARVGPADLAVGVVEEQLDGGGADRLACRRAVEDDVRHGLAAQVLGGELAHDPAHGVDDVGLAAAVGPDDAGEITGETDVVGSTKDLKPASLILVSRIEDPVATLKRAVV